MSNRGLGNKLHIERQVVVTRALDDEQFALEILDPVPRWPIQTLETALVVRHPKCARRGIVLTNWHRQPRWCARAEAFDYARGWIARHVCPAEDA